MLKRIFVDSNNQKNYCQLVSDLGRPIHGPLVLFRIGANLERLEREWSELTASCACQASQRISVTKSFSHFRR